MLTQKLRALELHYQYELIEYGAHPAEWEEKSIKAVHQSIENTIREIALYFVEKYAQKFLPSERIFVFSQFLGKDSLVEPLILKLLMNLSIDIGINKPCSLEEKNAYDYLDIMSKIFGLNIPIDFVIYHLGYRSSSFGEHYPSNIYNIVSQYVKDWKMNNESLVASYDNEVIYKLRERLKYLKLLFDEYAESVDNFRNSSWRQVRFEKTSELVDSVTEEIINNFIENYSSFFLPTQRLSMLYYFMGYESYNAPLMSSEILIRLGIDESDILEEQFVFKYLDRMKDIFALDTPIWFAIKYLGYDYNCGGYFSIRIYNKFERYFNKWRIQNG